LRFNPLKVLKYYFLFLFSQVLPCYGQQLAFEHLTVDDGLPSNQIYCGIQDRSGYIWLGTDQGLVRFDGANFRLFGIKDGLPDLEVIQLKEDSEGRIWISCFGKEQCYFSQGQFVTPILEDQKHWSTGYVSEVDGLIYISNFGRSPYVFDGASAQPCPYIPPYTYHVAQVENRLFAFGRDSVFLIEGQRSVSVYGYQEQPLGGVLGLIVADPFMMYSYFSGNTLFRWNGSQWNTLQRFQRPVGRLTTDSNGDLWLCSTESGAFRYTFSQADTLILKQHLLPDQKVNWMFEDLEGSLWFGTANDGVYILRKNAPVLFFPKWSANTQYIVPATMSGVWVGNDEGCIEQIGGKAPIHLKIAHRIGNNRVRRIVPLQQNHIWVATDGGIFDIKDTEKRAFLLFNAVKDIALRADSIWIGAAEGLSKAGTRNFQTRYVRHHRRVTTLGFDHDQCLWMGGIKGLFSETDSFAYNWGEKFPVLFDRIIAIANGGENFLWVVTSKSDLVLLKIQRGKVLDATVVNEHLSTPIVHVNSIATSTNRTWLATNQGVYGLDRNWNFCFINQSDGLPNNEVNAIAAKGDTLWCGTPKGMARFVIQPDTNKMHWRTDITTLSYQNGQEPVVQYFYPEVDTLKSVVLPNQAQLIRLTAATPHFMQRGKHLFRYEITPLLTDWYYLTFDNLFTRLSHWLQFSKPLVLEGNSQFSVAATLPPGRLRVEVEAYTIEGKRCDFADIIVLTTLPKWYQTIWFWLFIWAVIIAFLLRFWKNYHSVRALEADTTRLRLQALQLQINPHFIGNSINAIQQFFYPPDPVRANEYISAFDRLLRATMHFSEQSLITFQEELDYITDYLDMIKWRLGDRFRYDIDGAEHIAPSTPFPCMLLQPILENATQHGLALGHTSVLTVNFSQHEDLLTCRIVDNGPGFRQPNPRRKSKGLIIFQQKIESLNQLFHLNIQYKIENMKQRNPNQTGVCVTISFNVRQSVVAWQQLNTKQTGL
jgi:ligand-binding sensor domain-containing protein